MSRYIPDHPKKGSSEAYEWAERMRQARQKKARTKAAVREAGQLTEMQFFGPGGSLEVKPRKMRNNLYRACAWCKKSLGEVAPYSDKHTTHSICPTCLKKELSRTTKKNPGARYHEEAAHVAARYRKDARNNTEKTLYKGMELAHEDSARAAKSYGMNPRKRMKKNPIAIYNPPSKKPSYVRRGDYYLPAIIHPDGRKEVLHGEPLISVKAAKKYARLSLYDARQGNPPAPKVVGTIYNKAIEIRAKKTGSDLAGKYKHVFGKNVKILGLDNGDVVIHHTGGKRLWISREDYERSGRKHE